MVVVCTYCVAQCPSLAALNEHARTQHYEQLCLSCGACGYMSATATALLLHYTTTDCGCDIIGESIEKGSESEFNDETPPIETDSVHSPVKSPSPPLATIMMLRSEIDDKNDDDNICLERMESKDNDETSPMRMDDITEFVKDHSHPNNILPATALSPKLECATKQLEEESVSVSDPPVVEDSSTTGLEETSAQLEPETQSSSVQETEHDQMHLGLTVRTDDQEHTNDDHVIECDIGDVLDSVLERVCAVQLHTYETSVNKDSSDSIEKPTEAKEERKNLAKNKEPKNPAESSISLINIPIKTNPKPKASAPAKGGVRCGVCARRFVNGSLLPAHEHAHNTAKRHYNCHKCRLRFLDQPQLKLHIAKRHAKCTAPSVGSKSTGAFACEWCTERFEHAFQLAVHGRAKHADQSATGK